MTREEEWFESRLLENERLAPKEKDTRDLYAVYNGSESYDIDHGEIIDLIDGVAFDPDYDNRAFFVRVNGKWYAMTEAVFDKYKDLWDATGCEWTVRDWDGTQDDLDNGLFSAELERSGI